MAYTRPLVGQYIRLTRDEFKGSMFAPGEVLRVYDTSAPFYWAERESDGEKGLFYLYEFEVLEDDGHA